MRQIVSCTLTALISEPQSEKEKPLSAHIPQIYIIDSGKVITVTVLKEYWAIVEVVS